MHDDQQPASRKVARHQVSTLDPNVGPPVYPLWRTN